VISLLISCSNKKPKVETCARDFCLLSTLIVASPADREAVRLSQLSKDYVKQIVDHNDMWTEVCKNTNNDELPKAPSDVQD
jgi:hypothetical protein